MPRNRCPVTASPGWDGQDPRCGACLPVIHALRDDLTLLHVRDYDSGPVTGLGNQYHSMGAADFHIAMTDMLLTGFPVAGAPDNVFPPLRPDQVASGMPASTNAGNGYVSPAEVTRGTPRFGRARSEVLHVPFAAHSGAEGKCPGERWRSTRRQRWRRIRCTASTRSPVASWWSSTWT